ncbi:MAG: hypothetical protein D3914_08550, partial [Candidatus Electrothrix sp. LOE2]|nr:hypothetical protein [Candidatus Electrothrix sp. LOE2]
YKELHRMGYSISHRILYAGHYGVPQMRFRTTFIAIKGREKKITEQWSMQCRSSKPS